MDENRVAAPEARTLGHSGQETADKIIRNAETRSGSEQDAQSRPQGRQARSSYLGMSREPEAGAAADEPASLSSLSSGLGESKPSTEQSANPEAGERNPGGGDNGSSPRSGSSGANADQDLYVSSKLGLPLLSDSPTPLSSALNIPTLVNEVKPSRKK